MKFSIDKQEKYTLFTPEEEKIDSTAAPDLKAEFITLFQDGTQNLILDMKQVKYVDSSGLSSFLMAQRMAQRAKGVFVIAAATEHVSKLIKISKLDAVFEVVPTVQHGIDLTFVKELEKDIDPDDDDNA